MPADWNRKSSVNKSQENIGLLLMEATGLWRRALSNALKPYCLSYVQFTTLRAVQFFSKSEDVSQIKISEQLKMDINQTSQLLQKLESKNLIQRVSSRTDARVKQISLTEEGEHILEEMSPVIQAADTEYFSALELRKPIFVNLLHDLVRKSEAS